MARVFLSYDRRDGAKAALVAKALGRAKHSVWWDREIRGGRHFSKDIERALAEAEAIVVLWSRNSVESDWVRDEAAAGRDRGRLVPATLDGSAAPLGFRQLQTVDLSSGLGRGGSEALNALALAIEEMAGPNATPSSPQLVQSSPTPMSRRVALLAIGGGAAAVGALGYWRFGRATPAPDPKVTALLDQAWQSWSQGTSEGNNQAIGLYRRATAEAPDDPDAWGFLGCAYGDRGHAWVTGAERDSCWQRARQAGRHALGLDSKNAYGRAAVAYARPRRGNWTLMDREFRRAEADEPGKWLIVYSLALLMGEVGRFADAARLFASLKGSAPTATQYAIRRRSPRLPHSCAIGLPAAPISRNGRLRTPVSSAGSMRRPKSHRHSNSREDSRFPTCLRRVATERTSPSTNGDPEYCSCRRPRCCAPIHGSHSWSLNWG